MHTEERWGSRSIYADDTRGVHLDTACLDHLPFTQGLDLRFTIAEIN
jgi:hypothetical protein